MTDLNIAHWEDARRLMNAGNHRLPDRVALKVLETLDRRDGRYMDEGRKVDVPDRDATRPELTLVRGEAGGLEPSPAVLEQHASQGVNLSPLTQTTPTQGI